MESSRENPIEFQSEELEGRTRSDERRIKPPQRKVLHDCFLLTSVGDGEPSAVPPERRGVEISTDDADPIELACLVENRRQLVESFGRIDSRIEVDVDGTNRSEWRHRGQRQTDAISRAVMKIEMLERNHLGVYDGEAAQRRQSLQAAVVPEVGRRKVPVKIERARQLFG